MIRLTIKLVVIFAMVTSAAFSQRVRFLVDLEAGVQGFSDQTVRDGNVTNTGNITSMSSLGVGLNVGLPLRFEAALIGSSLLKLGGTSTTYTTSGTSSSGPSTFFIPKVGLELSRSFIWNERSFASGVNLGFGVERYWPGKLSAGDFEINYNDALGQYYRLKVVFKKLGRIQFEPNVTFRTFDLNAYDFTDKSGSYGALHPSLATFQVRNLSIGVLVLFGGSKRE